MPKWLLAILQNALPNIKAFFDNSCNQMRQKSRIWFISAESKDQAGKLPWHESNKLWGGIGALGCTGTIILTVVAGVTHDIRWMLLGAWPFAIIGFWAFIKLLRLRQWIILPCAILIGFGLLKLNISLRPMPNPLPQPSPPIVRNEEPEKLAIPAPQAKKLHRQSQPEQSAKRESSKPKPEVQPYFAIYKPEIIEATPELKSQVGTAYSFVLRFNISNIGKHTANKIRLKRVVVDKPLTIQPLVDNGSMANDFPPGSDTNYMFGMNLLPTMPPWYLVFAMSYKDIDGLMSFCQVWFFFQPGGDTHALPLHFLETSIQDRENIANYLKEELKDYCEQCISCESIN